MITDETVKSHYGVVFSDLPTIAIGQGEKIKNLDTVKRIYREFLKLEIDRSSQIIGIGGGIVCDVSGFAASTYLRGLTFGFVPTTLLAQVDASIGGKNGVNFQDYKNIIGVFRQPRFVLCDPEVLGTLPEKELQCGIAEIIKHALIKDSSLFKLLEREWNALLSLDKPSVEKIVSESIRIKAEVVQADALEAGERRKLNFGHTLGHAIEKEYRLPHGEAVSIGMVMAAKISESMGLLKGKDTELIINLLSKFGLPTQLPSEAGPLMKAVKKDKKREGEKIHFVLLTEIGNAKVIKISYPKLEELIHDLCMHR